MSNYRRIYVPGGTYFFTVVTHLRRPFLTTELARACLRKVLWKIAHDHPFQTIAVVLLPDHLHAVWTLPGGDTRYSLRWQRIKEEFSEAYLAAGGVEAPVSRSRGRKRERGIWQRRFWEHTCRDEGDLKRHVDYVHYNPVKHGLVRNVVNYPWSTFHKFKSLGEYEDGWGAQDPCPEIVGAEWDAA